MLVRVAAFMREAVAPQGRDDFKAANEAVKRIGNGAEDMDKHAYREWPLFKELRKSPEFAALFEQVFGEPLNKVVLQDSETGGTTPEWVN
jgi:hypothetical protein